MYVLLLRDQVLEAELQSYSDSHTGWTHRKLIKIRTLGMDRTIGAAGTIQNGR